LDNSINTVIVDNNNEIWCGTDYGVNCYNGKAWQSITTSNVLAGSQILQIAKGQSDDIWFSSFGGISHYNSAKGSQSAIQIDPTGSTPITENQLTSISITLSTGASLHYIAMGTLFDSQSQNITDQVKWTSSDNAVATISTDGLATGIGAGSSLITATLSGITSPAASLTVVSASIETSP
jgi:ligand-binding sensor domain-containing protein